MNKLISNILGGVTKSETSSNDEAFINNIKSTNLLTEATKKLYLKKIDIIRNELFGKKVTLTWVMNNPDEFKKVLLKHGKNTKGRLGDTLSSSTLSQFVIPIISIIISHRDLQEKDPELLHRWKKVRDEIRQPVEDQYDSNQPSERQSKALMSMKELETLRDELPDGSDAKLLISLYTMIEPIRSNYGNVKLFAEKPKKYNDNYMVLDEKPILVLNKYKTAKYYDTIEIDLPPELIEQIHHSLKRDPRDHIFMDSHGTPYQNANSFNKWANNTIKRIVKNKDFTLTMFRHIYLSDPELDLKNKSRKEKKEIASKFGHSLDTQSKYFWDLKKKDKINICK